MTHLVQRSELLDHVTYTEHRPQIQAVALAAKRLRRVVVAECLTFLFENHDTIRYQILEMMRTEKIVRERDIEHELATYNELLGQAGSLGVTLLVGLDDPEDRDRKLRAWLDLPRHTYVALADGTRIHPDWDARQISHGRLSAVQYLKFPVAGRAPIACGIDYPGHLASETPLSAETIAALQADLT